MSIYVTDLVVIFLCNSNRLRIVNKVARVKKLYGQLHIEKLFRVTPQLVHSLSILPAYLIFTIAIMTRKITNRHLVVLGLLVFVGIVGHTSAIASGIDGSDVEVANKKEFEDFDLVRNGL